MSSSVKNKNIALIGYSAHFFKSFFSALEEDGFTVFFVCADHYEEHYLVNILGISEYRVLDTSLPVNYQGSIDVAECRESLSSLEKNNVPRINDIIQMDRILRHKDHLFALNYIDQTHRRMEKFFLENQIELVSSGRDTALQLTSMLVAKKICIPWVVPTRFRIPLETYGFCTDHEFNNFITFRDVCDKDHEWANDVLKQFSLARQRPALKIAAKSFKDVLKLLGPHFKQFINLFKRSRFNKGNDYSRYTIPKIISMYFRRRLNMLMLNTIKPWSLPADQPFCIYALHTQPESSIDVAGSFFSDQISLIQFISRSMPVTHELYVKIHPTDVDGKSLAFYREIKRIPGVRLIHESVSSRELISKASIIFTLTGTIGHEAGLMGKPVISFGKNYYNSLPTVRYCGSPPEMPALIDECLNSTVPTDLQSKVIEWLVDYRVKVFDGEVNRLFGETPKGLFNQDLETLKKAYNALFEKLVYMK